jgi:acetoin utilization protein AcuB
MAMDAAAPEPGAGAIAAIMTPHPLTIEANASLFEARDLLQRHRVHHLLVVDRGRVVAVLSDRDLLRAMSPFLGTIGEQQRDSHTLMRPVFQLATYHPVTVRTDASVYEAAALLLEHGISCLPVVSPSGDVVGVVTSRDLVRGLLACALPAAGEEGQHAA